MAVASRQRDHKVLQGSTAHAGEQAFALPPAPRVLHTEVGSDGRGVNCRRVQYVKRWQKQHGSHSRNRSVTEIFTEGQKA